MKPNLDLKYYPSWVCFDCGKKYGRGRDPSYCTIHEDTCGICKQEKVMVTEPRDFGHLKSDWIKISGWKPNTL